MHCCRGVRIKRVSDPKMSLHYINVAGYFIVFRRLDIIAIGLNHICSNATRLTSFRLFPLSSFRLEFSVWDVSKVIAVWEWIFKENKWRKTIARLISVEMTTREKSRIQLNDKSRIFHLVGVLGFICFFELSK